MATSFFNNNCEDEVEELESAKQYADLARDWAIKLDGEVDGIDFSAKYWAQQAAAGLLKLTVSSEGTPVGDEFNILNFTSDFTLTQLTTNEIQIGVDSSLVGVTLLEDGVVVG